MSTPSPPKDPPDGADTAWSFRPEHPPTSIGAAGPLAGVAVALKANIAVAGWPLGCGSRALAGFEATEDAHVVTLLRAAGATLAGQAVMDEFAMGNGGCAVAGPLCPNPAAPGRVPGGSSGGAAALVAAGRVPLALGTDTGGSARVPAAYCGVFGLKPTRGRVSRRGGVALASSLDEVGFLAADPAWLAAGLRAVEGPDAGDMTTRPARPAGAWEAAGPEGPVRVGVWRPRLTGAEAEFVGDGLARARAVLGGRVAGWEEVEAPALEDAGLVYAVLVCAEALTELARYVGAAGGAPRGDGVGYIEAVRRDRGRELGPEVQRRLLFGAWLTATPAGRARLRAARAARARIGGVLADCLGRVDYLLTPVASGPPPFPEEVEGVTGGMASDRFTAIANLAGLPAVVAPEKRAGDGQDPRGWQLIGRPDDEPGLLAMAAAATGG